MHKLNIELKTEAPQKMRYKTAGDWQFKRNKLVVTAADTKNEWYNFLLQLHELVEAMMCKAMNISELAVDNFDIEFERQQQSNNVESGDSPDCPYYIPHQIAAAVERLVAAHLPISWLDYEDTLDKLELPDAT